MESAFINFYKNNLAPHLDPLEDFRHESAKTIKLRLIISLIIAVFAFGAFYSGLIEAGILISITAIVVLGLAYQKLQEMITKLRRPYKSTIMPTLLSFRFEAFEYIPNQRIAKSEADKSRLFPGEVILLEGEDFMRFRIGQTGIMFCESRIECRNLENYYFTNGIFIVATFNKNFQHETIVFKRTFNSILKRNTPPPALSDLNYIALEDTLFMKKFEVMGSDQVGSRFILTPSLMERLVKYASNFKSGISFSFIQNRLYCFIPNSRNLFEPRLFEPLNSATYHYEQLQQIDLFTGIVEELNLNVRIWGA